jgi:hypothetical protein
MRSLLVAAIVAITTLAPACMGASFGMPPGADVHQYIAESEAGLDPGSFRFKPGLCDGYDLKPEHSVLSEASFVRFLQSQQFEVRVEQQQVEEAARELHYVFVKIPGVPQTVPLRVAVLPSADDAGRSLYEAVLRRGTGAWGVHRANVAVLGPTGSTADDVALAALTKMACWGTFTMAGTDDAFVVPGAYAEP